MKVTLINECRKCHNQTEQTGPNRWECPYCGSIYATHLDADGDEIVYRNDPPKELPSGQIAARATQIPVQKITGIEIKPSEAIESDIYRESTDLDYYDNVNLITMYLQKGKWDEAKGNICKLKDLNEPCSIAAANWYNMAWNRQAHNDSEVVRSFSNITDAEAKELYDVFLNAMPDLRKRILDLVLTNGYVGDEATTKLLSTSLPFVFSETIYSSDECKEKVEVAFNKVISLGYHQTFKFLLAHTLEENEVDRYINYLERFAGKRSPLESQEYYSMIIAVDANNASAHHHLVEADIKANSSEEKCIADFENLLKYSQNPVGDVEKFIEILLSEKTTTEAKSEFMWSLLSYYHEDEDAQTQAMSQYADLLLKSQLWDKARDFYSAVLARDTRNAKVFFNLCLVDMQARNAKELIAKEESFINHPYYKKALAQAYKTDKNYAKQLENLIDSRDKRIKDEQDKKEKRRKTILASIITVVTIVAVVAASIFVNYIRDYRRYSANNIVLTLEDKVEPTKSSSHYDGYVVAFDVKIKNQSVLEILEICGDMEIFNAAGTLLAAVDCTFTYDILAGEETTFILNIDCRASDETLELYHANYNDLSATFKLTKVKYEGYEIKEYDEDPVTILGIKVGSDGISDTEKTYQEALDLFEQGKYADAVSLFKALGHYKDSNDYFYQSMYQNALSLYAQEKYGEAFEAFNAISNYKDSTDKIEEVTVAVISKAESFASTGDYVAAYTILEQIGYNDTYYLYQAYKYASEGYFADAVYLGLTVVCIPEGEESIPDDYFKAQYGGNQLEKVVLPSTLKYIGKSAFSGCSKLVEINFPNGLNTIEDYAFSGCKSLKSIELPNSVENMGSNVFEECSSLESVSLPDGLKEIPSYTFEGCSKLTTITIKNGVEVIGHSAFSGCSSLTSITFPESLKEIQGSAFMNCIGLVEIRIPSQVKLVGGSAFSYCSSLQKVTFANQSGWFMADYFSANVSDAQKNARTLKTGGASEFTRK